MGANEEARAASNVARRRQRGASEQGHDREEGQEPWPQARGGEDPVGRPARARGLGCRRRSRPAAPGRAARPDPDRGARGARLRSRAPPAVRAPGGNPSRSGRRRRSSFATRVRSTSIRRRTPAVAGRRQDERCLSPEVRMRLPRETTASASMEISSGSERQRCTPSRSMDARNEGGASEICETDGHLDGDRNPPMEVEEPPRQALRGDVEVGAGAAAREGSAEPKSRTRVAPKDRQISGPATCLQSRPRGPAATRPGGTFQVRSSLRWRLTGAAGDDNQVIN
jgi:hypothetical protein